MKKLLAIIMVWAVLLSLVGCTKTDDEAIIHCGDILSPTTNESVDEVVLDTDDTFEEVDLEEKSENTQSDKTVIKNKPTDKNTENKTSSSENKSEQKTENKTEKPVKKPTKNTGIEKIVDESYKYLKTGNIVKFYEKNADEYFTVSGENDGIMVYFKDGTKMGVVEAFKNKLVTLSDLKKYDVKYIKEWLHFGAFDLTETYDCDVVEKPQEFYRDKYFSYTFSTQKAQYVKYLDKDGKTWLLSEALKAGVADIDTAGILLDYDKKFIAKEIVILDETDKYAFINAPSRCFFTDEKYEYYYPKIAFITVYYPDGTDEDAKDALEKGKIKLTDLDKYDIDYYKVPVGDKNKEICITDHTKYYDFDLEKEEEEFYRDDNYIYLFPTQKREYVYLSFYQDDLRGRVDFALEEGEIDIASVLKEMDRCKIEYIKRPIGKK